MVKTLNVKGDIHFERGLVPLAFDKRPTVDLNVVSMLEDYPLFELGPEDVRLMLYKLRAAASLTKNEVRAKLEINSDEYVMMEETGVVCAYSRGPGNPIRIDKSQECIERLAKMYIHEGYEDYKKLREKFIILQNDLLVQARKSHIVLE